MSLKNRLIENIIAPVATNHSAIFLDAVVLKTNEKSNTCDITYTNEDGVTVEQKAVPVQLANTCIIDWFPKKREHVTITTKGGNIFITGPSYGNNYNTVRKSLELTEDIFSEASSCTMGGCIF